MSLKVENVGGNDYGRKRIQIVEPNYEPQVSISGALRHNGTKAGAGIEVNYNENLI